VDTVSIFKMILCFFLTSFLQPTNYLRNVIHAETVGTKTACEKVSDLQGKRRFVFILRFDQISHLWKSQLCTFTTNGGRALRKEVFSRFVNEMWKCVCYLVMHADTEPAIDLVLFQQPAHRSEHEM